MKVTLVQLRALLAVLDAEGFSAAADESGATQAALSYAVASLEKTAGGRVLERRPRIALTPLGAAMLSHARASVAAADRLDLAVDLHFGRAVGTVRLAASTTASASIVPLLREHWSQTLPGIDVRVLEGEDDEMPAWLADDVVDAAILINPRQTDPRARVVARDVFEAVVRSDHPFARLSSVPVSDLLDDPVLVSDSGCRAQILAICRAADPEFTPARDVRDLHSVMTMVATGHGVSIIPGLGRALIAEDVAFVPLDPIVERTLILTGPEQRTWSPAVAALIAESSEVTAYAEERTRPKPTYDDRRAMTGGPWRLVG